METTAAVKTSTLSPFMSSLLSIIIVLVIIYFMVQRHRKKKGKAPLRISSLFHKKKSSGKGGPWYGDYPKLITLDAFKKRSGRSYVVFDLETTGLDAEKDAIVEIGAVRVTGNKVTNQTYQQLVSPGVKISKEASEVNHITNDMVKGQPKIQEVLADFLAYVDGDLLVAHNAGFDASFLDNACARCGYESPKKYFDTMRLSVYWRNLKNRKLVTFLEAAGIENENAHRALSDAIATAKLCVKSMEKIK